MFPPGYRSGVAVTKSDVTTYDPKGAGLFVGGAGNVSVQVNGTVVVFTGVVAGTLLPLEGIEKVRDTGTSATNMTLLFR